MPAGKVLDVVNECGRAGVRAVVVITSGFSEVSPEGGVLECEIAAAASAHGMALIGPNCMGVMSSWRSLYATGALIMHPTPDRPASSRSRATWASS